MSMGLARREERAQKGIIQFAEEMQIIRDEKLYPNAGQTDAWKTYCADRWGMSESNIKRIITAAPVIVRVADAGRSVSVGTAATVATLDEEVQDAILEQTTNRDAVKEKAKAVRKRKKQIQTQEGREPTSQELIQAASEEPKQKRKPKPKLKESKFTHDLALAEYHIEHGTDIAVSTVLTDVENEYGWSQLKKIKYQLDRLEDVLTRPDFARDIDEEAAALLAERP